jgi:hypothetical protein
MRAVRLSPGIARNPRLAGAAALANAYQGPTEFSAMQNLAYRGQELAGAARNRIAQVYATPQGKWGLGLAATAPFVLPMVMGGNPENPDQPAYSTGNPQPLSTGTGLDAAQLTFPGVNLPDEAAVERELKRLENNQYFSALNEQALRMANAQRASIEQSQASQPQSYQQYQPF